MIQIKASIQWFNASIKIEFDLLKWRIKPSIYKNQHRAWCHIYLGPFMLGFQFDFKTPLDEMGASSVG